MSAFINFVKFAEQCGPFIMRLREKSASVVQDREKTIQLLDEMYQKVESIKYVLITPPACFFLMTCRSKRVKDEPACDALRQENDAIKAELVAYKETQTTLLQDLQVLKDEARSLVKRKVHKLCIFVHSILTHLSFRKILTMRLPVLWIISIVPAVVLYSLQSGSNEISSRWGLLLPRTEGLSFCMKRRREICKQKSLPYSISRRQASPKVVYHLADNMKPRMFALVQSSCSLLIRRCRA